MLNILITGCFAPGTSGTVNGIRAAGFDMPVRLFGVDLNPLTSKLHEFEAIRKLDANDLNTYVEELSKIIREFAIDIVLIQTTKETVFLSQIEKNYFANCKIAIPGDYQTIKQVNDKLSFSNKTLLLNNFVGEYIGFGDIEEGAEFLRLREIDGEQFYFKSRNLSGGRGIMKASNEVLFTKALLDKPSSFHHVHSKFISEIWAKRVDIYRDFFLSSKHNGIEFSVDCFIGDFGSIFIPRKRISIRNGISQVNEIVKSKELISASSELSKLLNLRGLFGFQFILSEEGQIGALECNPRIQGTNIASIMAGSNLLEYLIKDQLGLNYSVKEPLWGAMFRRISGGEII